MTTDIQTAARALMEAAERARRDALVNLEAERIDCRALIRKYDAARERLARLDAEYARVEAQKIEDIARQALERAQKCDGDHIGPICADKQCWLREPPEEEEQPKPEPYRAGLPPERLRKVWAEWEMVDGVVYVFRGNKYRCAYRPPTEWWDIGAEHTWRASYRPHGATWARVEAMADEAEKPTLLDLTKLPPGTVCEALEDIPRWNGRTIAAGVRFTLRDQSIVEGDKFPIIVTTNGENAYCIPALVPARVVKEGGEQ